MGLDDLFKHREHVHHDNHGYNRVYRDEHHGHHDGLQRYQHLFEQLKNKKKLLIALSVIAIIVVIFIITIIILFIPFILKGFEAIQKSGLKGLIETATPFLERLWSGAGK